jgi:hypothetical protein
MKILKKCILFYLFLPFFSMAQDKQMSIEIGKRTLKTDEPFTLTVRVRGLEQKPTCLFPEIEGLQKRGSSAAAATQTINGKTEVVFSVIQEYYPTKIGTIKVPSQTVFVNGTPLKSETFTLILATSKDESRDAFNELFGETPIDNFDDKAEAVLSLRADKNSVFVGEGFTVTLSLFVAKSNSVEMQFDNLSSQLAGLSNKIRSTNCWEQNFNLTEAQTFQVKLGGKAYDEYRLYRSVFYPLNTQSVNFGVLPLRMAVFKTLQGRKTKSIQTFNSKPISIRVKELPNHPLRNEVSVGNFSLTESIGTNQLNTGKSFVYELHLGGDGNISGVRLPELKNDSLFDFYPPEIRQAINTKDGNMKGDKTFRFQIIPKQAGLYKLSEYFNWIYFNLNKQRFDTLRSQISVNVTGRKIVDISQKLSSDASVYENVEKLDTSKPTNRNWRNILKEEANLLIVLMLLGMVFVFWPIKK